MNIMAARIADLDALAQLDSEVIGDTSRRNYIEKAISHENCIIVKEDNEIAGFLVYDRNFFDCAFIALIIVSKSKRRMGYASELLHYMADHSPTQKIFSSANQSNYSMQQVFKSNGFVKSGVVENLDDGDPEIIYYRLKKGSNLK
ncbi:GNAT family N-acetyltransferase [Rossellomorea vietnamensis]|uniref:GNAT family N-acetyltransferase n=1 Tax=Rossellomorea vietnamensis TaxID=218284 RepID=A0A5D4KJL7_9BACI|nr:GNAT family N-acetyltransferase [Rossellomorea vietnamensis]TYR77442.1 GNAT family N-acetyltransferase [Rossellomorea vietnamensis]